MKINHAVSLEPISPEDPCGPNLEYDTEYVLLLSKLQPKEGAQYGTFVDAPAPIHWGEIQKECVRLLARSKDITLLIIYTRCLLKSHQAPGLLAGLTLLADCLERYVEKINPPVEIDGEIDCLLRANALSALCDSEGLLGDLRDIVLVKNTALRLKIRDIERAFLVPRPPDALAIDSIVQQLQDLLVEGSSDLQALYAAYEVLQRLQLWGQTHLGSDAPSLQPILKLFLPLQRSEVVQYAMHSQSKVETVSEEMTVAVDVHHSSTPEPVYSESEGVETMPRLEARLASDPKIGRKQALEEIRKVRIWFELHEPSSPVILFLKQAEKSVGKKFAEIVTCVPLDLMQQWEQGGEERDNVVGES